MRKHVVVECKKVLRLLWVASFCVAPACAGFSEATGGSDTEEDDDESSTGLTSITLTSTFTTAATSGETDTTTGGVTATANTSGDPATGPDTDAATTDATATGTGPQTSSSSTGSDPQTGFGDCANNDPEVACLEDEVCFGADAFRVCARRPCASVDDCPLPPDGGEAPVQCTNIDGEGGDECTLDCSSAACPTGMVCAQDICAWADPVGCIDRIETSVPSIENVSTSGQGNDFVPSCAGGDAADYVVAFDVPADGRYVFDTVNSPIDTALSLIADNCQGDVIDCNNNIGGGNNDSQLNADLLMGDRVLVVVDGSTAGGISLNIRLEGYGDCINPPPGSCIDAENICIVNDDPATRGVCSQGNGCTEDDDCEAGAPAGGTATVTCGQVAGASEEDCYLNCAGGESCPTGMSCFVDTFCMWN